MKNSLYRLAPSWAQSAALSLRSLVRAGVTPRRTLAAHRRLLAASQSWSAAEMSNWQSGELAAQLDHAEQHVPYYRQSLGATRGRDPLERLQALPVLTKAEVRRAGEALRSTQLRGLKAFTSGTTGSPMAIYRSLRSIAFEHALVERQLLWAGWQPGNRRAWIRGDPIVPLDQTSGRFWRHNAAEHMLMCSSFHLYEHTARSYVEALQRFNPTIIQAYPSSIAFLAGWMLRHGVRHGGSALKGIVTSSEPLSLRMRQACEKAFGVKVFDWYGQSERVCAVGTCSHGTYHVMEESGLVELEPLEGGRFGLVGTALENAAMPLLRYRTADAVVPTDAGYRCGCGQSSRTLDQVIGRDADAIVTPDGHHHIMLDFIFDGLTSIEQGQIVQQEADHIIINVVLLPGASQEQAEEVRLRAVARFGPEVRVEVCVLPRIPLNQSGKFDLIISHVARRKAAAGQARTG